MRRRIIESCSTSTVVNYKDENKLCNETKLISKASCIIPDTAVSKKYFPINRKNGQYKSHKSTDQGITFYKDLSSTKANSNLPGRRMETKGSKTDLIFQETTKTWINRIQLSVKGVVRKAVITCENGTEQTISRLRDFYEGEIVDIPWTCSLQSASIRIK
jgi:hypothetical protein